LKFTRLPGKGTQGRIKMYYKKQQVTLLFFWFNSQVFQLPEKGGKNQPVKYFENGNIKVILLI
jgi:hypothetical protein